MVKSFVLDTNVLLHDPKALFQFEDNHVVIPIYVIEELDQFKKHVNELGRSARQVARYLDEYRKKGELSKGGVPLPKGGLLRVLFADAKFTKNNPLFQDSRSVDSNILAVALSLHAEGTSKVIFISKDTNLRIRANAMGLIAEDYDPDVTPVDELFAGYDECTSPGVVIDALFDKLPLEGSHLLPYLSPLRPRSNAKKPKPSDLGSPDLSASPGVSSSSEPSADSAEAEAKDTKPTSAATSSSLSADIAAPGAKDTRSTSAASNRPPPQAPYDPLKPLQTSEPSASAAASGSPSSPASSPASSQASASAPTASSSNGGSSKAAGAFEKERPFAQTAAMMGQFLESLKSLPAIPEEGRLRLAANQFLILTNEINPQHSALARIEPDGKTILPLRNHRDNVWGIRARNREQRFALEALLDPRIKLVSLVGKAGTGKTLLAIAAGLQAVLEDRLYQRLLVSRPVLPMGRDLGFLPGDLEDKLSPWMQPIFDNVEFLMGLSQGDKRGGRSYRELIEMDALQIEPLTYIRGRSIPRQYMIVDECFTAGHLITTEDGSVKTVEEICAGDATFGLCLSSRAYRGGRVDGCIQRTTAETIVIRTSSALLEVTPNHPFYVFSEMDFQKKTASAIQPGDSFCSPRLLPHTVSNDLAPSLAYWLGLILCDGHFEKTMKTIKIGCKKDIDFVQERFEEGLESLNLRHLAKHSQNTRGDHIFAVHGKEVLSSLSETYGIPPGKKSGRIQVPQQIWNAPLAAVKAFVSACFDAEGDVNGHQGKSLTLHFSTTSKRFVCEMNLLLKKFCVQSQITVIARKEEAHATAYRLTISGIEAWRFSKEIGFSLPRKKEACQAFFHEHRVPDDISRLPIAETLRKRLKSAGIRTRDPLYSVSRHSETIERWHFDAHYRDLFSAEELAFLDATRFDFVKECTPKQGAVEVYDFRVPTLSTFCVNGLISSNCQNLTPHEVKTIITRAGEDTKIVLTGDPYQIDHPYVDSSDNGLVHAATQFRGQGIAAHITLVKGERSQLAELAANLL